MLTFGSWLRTQTNRHDDVGHLATQAYNDDCFPSQATYPDVVAHIQWHGEGEISNITVVRIGAAKQAYDDYTRSPVR